MPSHGNELSDHPATLWSWPCKFFAFILPVFGSGVMLGENMISAWSAASVNHSMISKWWGKPGEWGCFGLGGRWGKFGIRIARPAILPWFLSIGLSLFIHSKNIHKISSMCQTLEIQFIHSSFHSTMLNVAPCSCSSKLSLNSGVCPDARSAALASGNGEEMSKKPLPGGGGNWKGPAELEFGALLSPLGSKHPVWGRTPSGESKAPNCPRLWAFFKRWCYLTPLWWQKS